jgi:hypothetical protein
MVNDDDHDGARDLCFYTALVIVDLEMVMVMVIVSSDTTYEAEIQPKHVNN